MADGSEKKRLQDLKSIQLLDTLPEKEYDDITSLAALICDTPFALVTLVTNTRQFFKSRHGLNISETPLELSFCTHALKFPQKLFIVEDARKDERFKDNPVVTGEPNIVFYAGMPLVSSEGSALGAFCVLDNKPRKLAEKQLEALKSLANQVVKLFELRKSRIRLKKISDDLSIQSQRLNNIINATRVGIWEWNILSGKIIINERWAEMLGYTLEELGNLNIDKFKKLLFHKDVQSSMDSITACFEKQGDFCEGDYRFLHKKGYIVWINIRGQVVSWSEDGRPLLMAGTHTDITSQKNNDLEIEQSEKRFKALVQNGSDLIAILDLEANYKYISPTSTKVLDIAPEEFIGKNAFTFIHPDDKEAAYASLLRLKNEKQLTVKPYRFKHGNGSWRWIETIITNLIDDPAVAGLVANSRDITERILTEEKLEKSEAYYRGFYESQTNYVLRTDMGGNYTYVNKKFVKEFGWIYPDGKIVGKNCLPSILDYHHLKVQNTVTQCIAEPKMVFKIEIDKPARNGDTVTTLWDFVCVVDAEGNPSEIQCIGLDITDRIKFEKALKESESRYYDLFHLSPLPKFVYDLATLKFLDVNKAAIKHYGYSYSEFLNMTIKEISAESEISVLETNPELPQQKGKQYSLGESVHKKKNGEEIIVDLRTNILSYKGKEAKVVLVTDITERYKHIQAIEAQNEKLKKIAWTQSHVVRAPLARIMGLTELLRDDSSLVDKREKEQLLKYLLQSATEFDEIIRNIVNTIQQDEFSK